MTGELKPPDQPKSPVFHMRPGEHISKKLTVGHKKYIQAYGKHRKLKKSRKDCLRDDPEIEKKIFSLIQ